MTTYYYYGVPGTRHRFCKITGYCEKCGMPKDWFSRHDVVVPCITKSDNIVSLDWWRHLVAHRKLQDALVASVELQ